MADDDLGRRLADAASSLAPARAVDPVPIADRARRSHRRRGTARAGALVVAAVIVGAIGVDRIVGPEDDPAVETSSDGFEAGGWERLPDGPLSDRVGATAVWNGEEVVVVGGSTYLCPPGADCAGSVDPPFSDGAAYDPSTREWRPIAPAPAAFYGEGAAVVAGDLYFLVSCAIERFTADDVDACPSTDGDVAFTRYDADADEWILLDAPPTARDYGLAAVGRFVVAFSGSDERGESPDLIFDTESSTWQEIPDDPMPAVFDRTVVSSAEGEALILIGAPTAALSDPSQDKNAVARFDLASRTWEALPSPPGRGYRGWGVDDLVVLEPHFGGHGGSLDPATDTWSELPPGPHIDGWENHIAGVIGRTDAVYTDASGWLLDVSQSKWIEISPPDGRGTFPFSNVTAVGRDMFLFGGDRWNGGDGELLGDAWMWRAPRPEGRGEPSSTTTSAAPAASDGATRVTITCTADSTTVDHASVIAAVDGVHLSVVDESGRNLEVRSQALDEAENDSAARPLSADDGEHVAALPPGSYLLLCSERDGPEHMTEPSDTDESVELEVLDPGGTWQPAILDCGNGMMQNAIGDYVAGTKGAPGDPLELATSYLSELLGPGGEVRQVGYPEPSGDGTVYVFDKDGRTRGITTAQRAEGGWLFPGHTVCADDL